VREPPLTGMLALIEIDHPIDTAPALVLAWAEDLNAWRVSRNHPDE
jgi:hypothetical protein